MRAKPSRSLALWLAAGAMQLPASAAPPAEEADGAALLAQFQCGACHVIGGVPGATGTLAPTLDGLARRSYLAGRVPHTRDALQRWIVDPASLVPGTAMPAMGVTPAQAARMVEWFATREPVQRQRSRLDAGDDGVAERRR